MDYNSIIVAREETIATVTLNRASDMNALTREMRLELAECFERLEADDGVNAVIITGGEYVFCAGMDLNELALLGDADVSDYMALIIRYLEKIYSFRKPVIAAVGGIALGGGFNLAVVCDIIVASETAIFGHPELKFGLNPLFDPLCRIVGPAKAKEITMLGEPIGANEALRIGLVNKVAPPERFMEEARGIARALARRSPKAIEAVKRISDIVTRLDKRAALEYELDAMALLFSRAETKEHMKRFLDEMKSRKKK